MPFLLLVLAVPLGIAFLLLVMSRLEDSLPRSHQYAPPRPWRPMLRRLLRRAS